RSARPAVSNRSMACDATPTRRVRTAVEVTRRPNPGTAPRPKGDRSPVRTGVRRTPCSGHNHAVTSRGGPDGAPTVAGQLSARRTDDGRADPRRVPLLVPGRGGPEAPQRAGRGLLAPRRADG